MIGSKEKLKWSIRYKIALGVAEGLVYLHRGCHRRIIHRDIKAANILLTHDFLPQVRYKIDALKVKTYTFNSFLVMKMSWDYRYVTLGLRSGYLNIGHTILFPSLRAHSGEYTL